MTPEIPHALPNRNHSTRRRKKTALALILALGTTILPGCAPAAATIVSTLVPGIITLIISWRIQSSIGIQAKAQEEEVALRKEDLELRRVQENTSRITAEAALLQAKNQERSIALEEKKVKLQALESAGDTEDPGIRAELDRVQDEVEEDSIERDPSSAAARPPESPELAFSPETTTTTPADEREELEYELGSSGVSVSPGVDSDPLFGSP